MTSTNTHQLAGAGYSPTVQLDADLIALLELTDQLGHHVEHRAAVRLLAHMDAANIAYLDTGTTKAIPRGHETDTGLITLVGMMPGHLFTRHRKAGTWRLTRAAIARRAQAVPEPIVTAIELITLCGPDRSQDQTRVFINGSPITASHVTVDPAAPWPNTVWERHVTATLTSASPAARATLAAAYARTPGARYITEPKEPRTDGH
ncbi:hypothetical protein [Mycobacteroides abscessus]|uniref:Uncharacterized protein n=1 Tax=Mycobacteroides abscessus subsp. bolletii CRM-0020 TaxID=1306401 RepID=A0A829HNV5_9MYCO|nr:hypothetical protein [Mycobacteroides abscessus]EPQ21025.1 hypothetical protein J108_23740 [Mycobacteroides abscessus subsp. bolletii CRM-0020]SIA44718.1 Uncharacterised protein [Mycobacteroides abscessus subsp. abscessus]SIA54385.1 Uncharacterised protein [Mycobacteroides abscessus subsp. abscessus]